MKVYCKDCKHVSLNFYGEWTCKISYHIANTSYEQIKIYHWCCTINGKNDCKDFKPKLLFRLRRIFRK